MVYGNKFFFSTSLNKSVNENIRTHDEKLAPRFCHLSNNEHLVQIKLEKSNDQQKQENLTQPILANYPNQPI